GQQHPCAGEAGCVEFSSNEVALRAVVARHDELVTLEFDKVAHHIDEGGGMNDVVVLQRIVEQQRAPTRPAVGGARSAQDAESIGSQLPFAEHDLWWHLPAAEKRTFDLVIVFELHLE